MSAERLDTIFGIRAEVDERSISASRAALQRQLGQLEKRAVIKIRFQADNQIRASLTRIEDQLGRVHRGVTRVNSEMAQGARRASAAYDRAARSALRFGTAASQSNRAATAAISELTARTDRHAQRVGRLGDVYSRTFSRLEFLLTALVAGFATDVIVSSARDFAALNAQLRGTEIAASRAGLNYDDLIQKLTVASRETGNFALRQKDAADALNKLLIGGLQPTANEIQRQKQIALGAATLFGDDPSKLFERFSAAGLRQSTRILDDLGIVLRVKQAQELYAESLGKTAKELTALEKQQAFYKASLQATGTEALIAAAKLETPFLTLQKTAVVTDKFRLALGEELLGAILPTATGISQITDETIKASAEMIVFTARIAGAVTLLRGFDILLSGLSVRMAAFGAAKARVAALDAILGGSVGPLNDRQLATATAARTAAQSQVAAGQAALRTVGAYAALTAAVIGVTLAYDDYNERLQESKERQTDFLQTALKMQQFLQSSGFGTPIQFEANQVSQRLLSAGAPAGVASSVSDISASANQLLDDLEKQADAWEEAGVGADTYREAVEAARGQVDEMISKVEEGARSGTDFGEDMKGVSDILDGTLKPSLDDIIDKYEETAIAAEAQSAKSVDALGRLGQFVVGAGALIRDVFDQIISDFANANSAAQNVLAFIAGKAISIGSSVATGIANIFNSLVDNINQLIGNLSGATLFSIPTLGLIPGAGPLGLPGIGVTGSKAVTLPSTSFRLSRVDTSGLSGVGAIGDIIAGAGASGFSGALADDRESRLFRALQTGDFSNFGGGNFERFAGNFFGTNQIAGVRDTANQARALLDELVSLGVDVPGGPEGKKRGGGGGGGKKTKEEETREDIFKKITERLAEQLKLIEAERDTQTELLELGSLTAEEEIKQLDIKREETKIEALNEIKAQGLLDLLAGEEALRADLIASLSAIVALEDDRREKMQEALDESAETIEQLKIENELRRLFGEEVDKSAVGQKAISEMIDIYLEFGQEGLDEWKKVPGNMQAINEGLADIARQTRETLLDQAFNFRLGGLSFESRLAQAREPDSNRDAILGYNATLNELTATIEHARQLMDEGFIKPGDEGAVKLGDTIRDLVISMEEQITSIKEGGFLLGAENKAKLDEARTSLTQSAVDLANQLAPDPLGLSQATTGFDLLGSVASQFAGTLAAAGNQLIGAIGGATAGFGGDPLDAALLNSISLLEGSGGCGPGGCGIAGGPRITIAPRPSGQVFQTFRGFRPKGKDKDEQALFDTLESLDPGGRDQFFPPGVSDAELALRGLVPTGATEQREVFPGPSNNGLTLNPADSLTTGAQEAMGQEIQVAKERTLDFGLALAQSINQILASSRSMEELEQAAIGAASQLVNQFAQAAVPGAGGLILGGLLSFGINQFLGDEQAAEVDDEIQRVLLVNPKDVALGLAEVRDREEIAHNKQWQHSFALQASSAR